MSLRYADGRSARQLLSTVAALAAVALLSGCAVGPNFHRPAAPALTGYTREPLPATTASAEVAGGEQQRFVQSLDIPQQWWTLFQSPPLNALIDKALKANPSLVAAQAALRQAMELVRAQQGFFYPTIQASFSQSRQQTSATFSPPLSTSNLTYVQRGGGGRAGSIVTGEIAATRDIIAISTKSLELLRRQFELGYIARLDVAAQEAARAQVMQTLPPLRKQLAQNRDLLTALAGRFPSEELEERFELATLHLPQNLPVSLPSKLVEQRPDVRGAEAQLHAASAQIGVAIAARLPQFTITAAAGGIATQISQMFADANPSWMVAGTVAQTIFAGGTLLHRQRAAEAALEQAAAQDRSTVITGFQNVADTLYALENDAESLNAAVLAERAAKVTLDITLKQQQLGAVSYLALLSAEQANQQTLITRVQAQASRFANTAALFQALGGGWWDRPADPDQ